MKQNIHQLLQSAFEAPPPAHKEEFLRTAPRIRISNLSFILYQAAYIRKWIWVISAFAFALSLSAVCLMDQEVLPALSALIPFIAISVGIESGSSSIYNMAELELSSRFSLKSVLLARMEILGISHLFLLCILIPLGSIRNTNTLWQTGVYLLVPYLVTTGTSLWISRKIRGKDANYAYIGTAAIVSGASLYLPVILPCYYQTDYLFRWVILLIIFIIFTVTEFTKIIQETEELRWSLS